jgi:hypothetical protein
MQTVVEALFVLALELPPAAIVANARARLP